jgi:phospho-N-acetylmuramoyl-pentapeptide-transferase
VFYFLHRLHEPDSWRLVLNLFRYVTFRAAAAAATAFLVTVILMPYLIRRLRALKVTEKAENPDSEKLADLHRHKNGTPTMGGLGMLAGVLSAALLWADVTNRYVLVAVGTTLALGLLGFADDWMKLTRPGRRGMRARTKLLLQCLVACAAAIVLVAGGAGPFSSTRLAFPFVKPDLFAPELGGFYAILVVFLVVGSSNAVNLTDGLDGLASGCVAVAALAYAALAYVAGHAELAGYLGVPFIRGAEEMVILCAALGGSALGFLWYNTHPAEIFMGDTGSLSIGGLLAVAACVAKQELILGLVGGVFVIEAGSVLLQVASFKLSGRRLFRIAPLHHHFQFKGWSEDKVVVRFWIVAVILALASVATLKVR